MMFHRLNRANAFRIWDNDTDGFGNRDLSLADEEILNGLDPLDFEISYYETLDNANRRN